MNIRSISNKFDKLTNFLGQLRVKFPIVGIPETWLDDCDHFSDIAVYNDISDHLPIFSLVLNNNSTQVKL